MFVIGERINPAGKRELACAIREAKAAFIQKEAMDEERSGADALDINVYLPDINRSQAMRMVVQSVRCVSKLPLVVDDQDPSVIQTGLECGAPNVFINSPISVGNLNKKVVALAKQFKAEMLFVPLEKGRALLAAADRIRVTRLVLEQLEDAGISRDRVIVDAVLFALKQVKGKVTETLETIRQLKSELGVRAAIGLSNISYGLQRRRKLNARFLQLAKGCGLDVVICDPLQKEVMAVAKNKAKRLNHGEMKQFLEFAGAC